jgi:hypothetical protein
MDLRLEAANVADSVLEKLEQPVAPADVPSVRAVIMECALFENPMPDLKFGVHSVGSYYNVTVQGYRNLFDMIRFVNTMAGNHRSIDMSNVTHCYLQNSDTTYWIVIQIAKIDLHVATSSTSSSYRSSAKPIYSSRTPLVKRTE